MCSYSLFTHDCYRGKNCVKNFLQRPKGVRDRSDQLLE